MMQNMHFLLIAQNECSKKFRSTPTEELLSTANSFAMAFLPGAVLIIELESNFSPLKYWCRPWEAL